MKDGDNGRNRLTNLEKIKKKQACSWQKLISEPFVSGPTALTDGELFKFYPI